ncbi:MAG: hypothetical protein J6Q38_00695, partial [Clostridia bacterium]|nr:hypothetical protein [Clostridia bacterium]
DRLVVYASNKMLYSISLTKKTKNLISTIQFQSEPKAINYNYSGKDVLILSFKKEGLFIIYENSVEYVKNAPSITSMCIHSERLFATSEGDSTELWFSDDFNPTNWFVSLDEAGYVDLPDERGKLLKVISFLDYVYVFRSYGISRVTAYGDQREFSVDNLYNNIGKIYANTVTECGGYVIFLTSSGIYRFNGIDAVKILPFYDKYLKNANNDSAKGVYYNGKLYLSLNMMIDGKTEEGVVLVYDIENKVSYLARGLKISDFELITGSEYQIYAISSDKICKIDKSGRRFNVPLNKVWDSGENDYSIDSVKTLEKIKINFNGNIQISIWVDKKLYVYDLQDGQSELLTMLKGKNFKIKITSRDSSPVIYKPTFYFSYLKEGLW